MQEIISHESGFSFQLVALRDYIRKDGRPTQIKVWRANCIKCGAAFEVTTPQTATRIEQSHAFNTRCCPDHRGDYQLRKQALKKARAALRAKRGEKIKP